MTGSGRSRRPWLDRVQFLAQRAALFHEIIVILQAEKNAIGNAVIAGEAEVGVGGHGALAEDDLVDPARRYPNCARQRILRQACGLEEILKQDFARMGIGQQIRRQLAPSGSRRFQHSPPLHHARKNKCAIDH